MQTPFMWAVIRGHVELCQLLLDNGADPNARDTLGATPLRELVGLTEGITRIRGQWRQVRVGDRDIPVMPTFHPAYVLRQYTQEVRRAVWEDLKAAKTWVDKAAGS
jgi:DNA polymerase